MTAAENPFGEKYRVEQRNLAKFSDTCSVGADGRCIGSPNAKFADGRKAGNSNMQESFCTTHSREEHKMVCKTYG